MARTVTAHLFHAVNGVVESPNEWQFDAFGEAEMAALGDAIADVTDTVIGRRLWQEWSQYWPGAAGDDAFKTFVNGVRKHVVSSTLAAEPGWNSTTIAGDPVEHVRRLKAGDGGRISVMGGIETTRTLFLAGVIDELTLTTHPAVGVGRRLFDDSVGVTRLDLVRSQITPVGNAILTYRLRPQD
jgi:RNA polymerase sigma-70 factor (ECF subfamily)